MTDIEEKALALVNEVRAERGYQTLTAIYRDTYMEAEALFRAVEAHEAYEQKVSDAVVELNDTAGEHIPLGLKRYLNTLIIPKPKPDPLEQVIAECDDGTWETIPEYAEKFRAALGALGFEIREKGQ